MTWKWKAVDDGIQSLERRKLELSADIDSLTASADQLAEKAESSRDMSILVISNAMRKACKEKKDCWNDRAGQAVGKQASWVNKFY